MKAPIASIVIALASVLQIGGVATHATPADGEKEAATGTVLSADSFLFVLQMESGMRRRFATNDATLMATDLLRRGDRVSVTYRPGSLPAEVLELVVLSQATLEVSLDSGDHPEQGSGASP